MDKGKQKYDELEARADARLRQAGSWLDRLIDSPWTLAILGAAAIAGVIVLAVVMGSLGR